MSDTDENSTKNLLIAAASAILEGRIHLIEGIRNLCSLRLRNDLDAASEAILLPIVGVDSETDSLPLGKFREKCSEEYRARSDEKMSYYVSEYSDEIFAACRALIVHLSRQP